MAEVFGGRKQGWDAAVCRGGGGGDDTQGLLALLLFPTTSSRLWVGRGDMVPGRLGGGGDGPYKGGHHKYSSRPLMLTLAL